MCTEKVNSSEALWRATRLQQDIYQKTGINQRAHSHVPLSKYVLRNVVITRKCSQMGLWSFSSKMWFMYWFSSSLEHVIYMCVCVCVKYISSVRSEDADILCLFTQDLVTDPQFESRKVFMMTWYAAKYYQHEINRVKLPHCRSGKFWLFSKSIFFGPISSASLYLV